MTTSELKQQIDKVLGNSIRCLLPSYWWKRLFHQVADRIDEVEQKMDNLPDGVPIVSSESALNRLDVTIGSLASIANKKTMKFSECYVTTDEDNKLPTDKVFAKLTPVTGIEMNFPLPDISTADTSIQLVAEGGKALGGLTISKGVCCAVFGLGGETQEVLKYWILSSQTMVDELNEYLSQQRWYFLDNPEEVGAENMALFDQIFTIVDCSSDVYVKGLAWEKLAKESDLVGIEGGNEDDVNEKIEDAVGAVVFYVDTNGGQLDDEYIAANAEQYKRLRKSDGMLANRPVYVKNYDGFLTAQMVVIDAYKKVGLIFETYEGRRLSVVIFPNGTYSDIADAISSSGAEIREFYTGESLTAEQKAWNLETAQAILDKKAIVICNGSILGDEITTNNDGSKEFRNSVPTPQGVLYAGVKVEEDGTASVFFRQLYLDDKLSDKSINAVQNKVVTAALNNKVDKVQGKQLSTEDFTTVLKTKLEGLNNYDDTDISNAVARLRDDFDSLTQEDISAAIENFNEIISFLDGIEDSESLGSIIASIEQQIASKQDKLVSGTNIKTINGESILGEGNIVVNVDTSNLATKQELNAKQDIISDLETIRSGAALGATALQEHQDISHLATKEEVTNLQNEVIANEKVVATSLNDLNTRIEEIAENVGGAAATKEELAEAIEGVNATITEKEIATNEAIAGVSASVDALRNDVAETYATKEDLEETNESLANLTNEILTNEKVVAAAFNDVNDRLNAISENVSGTTVTKGEFETTVTTLNESIATKADATSTSEAITGLQTSVSELNTSLGNYATTEALNTEITNITNEIITNEEITAAAFADLNTRLLEVVSRLDALENN